MINPKNKVTMKRYIFRITLVALMGFTAATAKAQFAASPTDIKPLLVGQAVPDIMLTEYSGGKNKGFVPVVSTFVVGADKNILFEDIRVNSIPAAARIKGSLLMAVLENLVDCGCE